MLLIELTERIRPPGAALIVITMEAFAIADKPEDPVGVGIPGTLPRPELRRVRAGDRRDAAAGGLRS